MKCAVSTQKIVQSGNPIELIAGSVHLKVYPSDVLLVLSDNHHVMIRTLSGECRLRIRFSSVREILEESCDSFILVNRGILVNLSHVCGIEGGCLSMRDGSKVPVRKNTRRKTAAAVLQFRLLHGQYTP